MKFLRFQLELAQRACQITGNILDLIYNHLGKRWSIMENENNI